MIFPVLTGLCFTMDRNTEPLKLELEKYSGNLAPGGVSMVHDTEFPEWPQARQVTKEFAEEKGLIHMRFKSARGLDVLQRPE